MRLIGLARYFSAKYAGNDEMESDISFGVPINAAKTRILKDKLIAIYGKLIGSIVAWPAFAKLEQELKGNAQLQEFKVTMGKFAEFIENNSLKESFGYNVKLIHELNKLRDGFQGIPRDKLFELESTIKSVQDAIWKESKRILNIHDLKGVFLDFPEDVRSKVKDLVPTWDYGPGKSPAYNKIKRRQYETPSDLIKRLMREGK